MITKSTLRDDPIIFIAPEIHAQSCPAVAEFVSGLFFQRPSTPLMTKHKIHYWFVCQLETSSQVSRVRISPGQIWTIGLKSKDEGLHQQLDGHAFHLLINVRVTQTNRGWGVYSTTVTPVPPSAVRRRDGAKKENESPGVSRVARGGILNFGPPPLRTNFRTSGLGPRREWGLYLRVAYPQVGLRARASVDIGPGPV